MGRCRQIRKVWKDYDYRCVPAVVKVRMQQVVAGGRVSSERFLSDSDVEGVDHLRLLMEVRVLSGAGMFSRSSLNTTNNITRL